LGGRDKPDAFKIRKSDLALLRAPRRITQRLKDVVAIQIRIVGQELIDR